MCILAVLLSPTPINGTAQPRARTAVTRRRRKFATGTGARRPGPNDPGGDTHFQLRKIKAELPRFDYPRELGITFKVTYGRGSAPVSRDRVRETAVDADVASTRVESRVLRSASKL